ncbi:MAG: ester cyclase [Thermoleophilaceae bacterium]
MAVTKPANPRRSGRAKVNEKTALSYFDAVGRRDPDAMAGHWHADGVGDLVPIGILRGPGGVRSFFSELFTAVPDTAFAVENVVADARGATVQWRLTGTFDGGAFQGLEATGRRLELRGCDCLEIDDDGRITRNTAYYDGAAFARGIGMLPAQDSTAERAMRAGFNAVTRARAAVARRTGETS